MSAELKSLPAVAQAKAVMPKDFAELEARAAVIADSKLIPVALQGKKADVAIILQMGWELDIPPMQAINGITVIQGKPTVDPQLAVALIRSRVPEAVIIFEEITPTKVSVLMAPSKSRMDEGFRAVWTIERAARMGLTGKDNYKKQPETMLKWRAVGEAARTVFPHVLKGLYLTPEMEDVDTGPQAPPSSDKRDRILSRLAPKDEKGEIDVPSEAGPTHVEPYSEPEAQALVESGPKGLQEIIARAASKGVPEDVDMEEWEHPDIEDDLVPSGQHKGKPFKEMKTDYLEHVVKVITAKSATPGATTKEDLMMATKAQNVLNQRKKTWEGSY